MPKRDDDRRTALLGSDASEAAARACLERAAVGVLGLADGGEAYTLPISFGFDPELSNLYFMFAFDDESRKRAFLDTTETASFCVVDADLPDAWESVIVAGPLEELPENETAAAYAALGETATFPALYTFEEYVDGESMEQSLYRLRIEEISARHAGEEQLREAASGTDA